MTRIRRSLNTLLVVLCVLLALAAVPGGIALLVGFYAPPVTLLIGSVFSDFTIPGLSLVILVGGSAVLAALLLIRKHRLALPSAFASGLSVMCFEFAEVLAIGSPPGAARIMQFVSFGVGVGLTIASVMALVLSARGSAHEPRRGSAPEPD